MRSIKLNGNVISGDELDGVLTVKNLLEKFEPIFNRKMLVVERKGEMEARTDKYTFTTTKGKFTASMKEQWHPIYESWIGKEVNITGKNAVIFQAVELNAEIYTANSIKLRRGDIFLFKIGSRETESYLGIALTDYEDQLFLPPDPADAIIGRVIGGGRILQNLTAEDFIREIVPEYVIETLVDRLAFTDLIEDGMEIYTSMDIELSDKSSHSVESFLSYLRNYKGLISVDEVTQSYIRSISPPIFEPGIENNRAFRDRGMVFIRNEGERKNSIYCYKKLRMPHHAMNAVGTIRSGVELIDVAKQGDGIAVHTEPVQVFLVGMTQREAEGLLDDLGIKMVKQGDLSDNAIIVSQKPETTIEIFEKRVVETMAISPDRILRVELFEESAPMTVHYLKEVAGLYRNYLIGKLSIDVAIDSLTLFKGKGKKAIVKPENTPAKGAGFEEGVIGITNMRRPHEGAIGIRLVEDPTFGPTGEVAESTNLVGRVTQGLEIIRGIKRGDIYFLDVTPREEE
ncbi:MAG: methyl-coenzyme M reductase-associated protein Mmp3 [Candidatus Syntropharchaeales archaeon]